MDRSSARRPALVITPSQTVGPFFAYCLTPRAYRRAELASDSLVTADVVGDRITIGGCVFDGDGRPVPEAVLEFWQADGRGRYAGYDADLDGSEFCGFGRAEVDSAGRFALTTVKPGAVALASGQMQAPHIDVALFGKGLQRQLFTRIYFPEEVANTQDPILQCVPALFRPTLLCRAEAGKRAHYEFDIWLQGEKETTFFSV